jgi:hypothetical protein
MAPSAAAAAKDQNVLPCKICSVRSYLWIADECREATKVAATVAGMSTMSIGFGACRAKLVDHLPSFSGHFTCFSELLGAATTITLL